MSQQKLYRETYFEMVRQSSIGGEAPGASFPLALDKVVGALDGGEPELFAVILVGCFFSFDEDGEGRVFAVDQ